MGLVILEETVLYGLAFGLSFVVDRLRKRPMAGWLRLVFVVAVGAAFSAAMLLLLGIERV